MATQGKRRALGQHFLKDAKICQAIADRGVELAHEAGAKTLLEIGPGRGAITYPLLENLGHHAGTVQELILAERDAAFASFWRDLAQGTPENSNYSGTRFPYRVVEGDFANAESTPDLKWARGAPIAVVSNLPYSAGTAIVQRLARMHEKVPVMLLMFQAEVAQRLRALPGTKAWGSLSVWIQNRWSVEKFLSVGPGAFSPPPEVQSEVVILRRRATPLVPDVAPWEDLLRVAFAFRRKMLRSGLPPRGPWRNALVASGVDGTKRAEALSWDEWNRLLEALRAQPVRPSGVSNED